MNCVPKFNHLLQSLPISIPLKFFKQFDRLCDTFLWSGKHPRLNLRKLQRPVDQGALGIPNLLLYHFAFGLRHMIQWSLPPERGLWFGQIDHLAALEKLKFRFMNEIDLYMLRWNNWINVYCSHGGSTHI